MPDQTQLIDISKWVDRAKGDDVTHLQPQAAEIILHAIAMERFLSECLYLKGGVLMGLVYASPRQTSDIDFSSATPVGRNESAPNLFKERLNSTLPRAAVKLGYPDMAIRVQSVKGLPPKIFPNARFPALKIKVAYAERNSHQEILLFE